MSDYAVDISRTVTVSRFYNGNLVRWSTLTVQLNNDWTIHIHAPNSGCRQALQQILGTEGLKVLLPQLPPNEWEYSEKEGKLKSLKQQSWEKALDIGHFLDQIIAKGQF